MSVVLAYVPSSVQTTWVVMCVAALPDIR